MNAAATALAELFRRDLSRLRQQIAAFPDDELLWGTVPGVSNSAGNLALHLEGNLREYVGRQLGQISYNRNRPLEFSNMGVAKTELVSRIESLHETIPAVLASLSNEQMEEQYPEVVLEKPLSTQAFLFHLYGHLNWHLGQIDYLRRTLTSDGALARVSL